MELIHLLLNSVKSEMCLLCFKESANTQNVRSELEIKSQYFNETLSIADIVNYLFPSFELTLTQTCDDCTDLIIRMFIAVHRNNFIKKIVNIIIDIFNKEISQSNLSTLDSFEKCLINVNLSEIINTLEQSNKALSRNSIDHITVNELYENKVSNNETEENLDTKKQCLNCFKLFDNVKKFKIHLKSHRQKSKKIFHQCNYCNYNSLCKDSLQGHINKNHLKIKPFNCKICYKTFYHKKNLVEHQTCHRQRRNEICEVCGDTFIYKKNLLEHLRLHSGERPYNCEICGKRFVTSGRKLEHVKRSHSEKKECCLLCEKKFSLNKELTRHMKTVHS